MNTRSLAQVLLVVVLLGASAALFWRSSDQRPINLNPYQALGTIAAEEVSRSLGGQGRIAVAIPDPGSERDPVAEAQLEAFKESLKRQGQVAISAIETVKMDPFLRMQTGGAIPAEQFTALRQRYADLAGLVLFIGLPILSPSELDALRQTRTRLMVVSAALPGYDALLHEGVLQFAIVPRTVAADSGRPPGPTLREVFDQEYVILRPDVAGSSRN
jgi:hypothetical protein